MYKEVSPVILMEHWSLKSCLFLDSYEFSFANSL